MTRWIELAHHCAACARLLVVPREPGVCMCGRGPSADQALHTQRTGGRQCCTDCCMKAWHPANHLPGTSTPCLQDERPAEAVPAQESGVCCVLQAGVWARCLAQSLGGRGAAGSHSIGHPLSSSGGRAERARRGGGGRAGAICAQRQPSARFNCQRRCLVTSICRLSPLQRLLYEYFLGSPPVQHAVAGKIGGGSGAPRSATD